MESGWRMGKSGPWGILPGREVSKMKALSASNIRPEYRPRHCNAFTEVGWRVGGGADMGGGDSAVEGIHK